MLTCFKHKNDLLCEDKSGAFILFSEGTKCTVLGNSKYCLTEGEFNKVRDFGATQFAIISDLNQIRDAFIVNQERDNYNMYITENKLKKIQNVILRILSSLSISNPQILNDYLKGQYFTRPLENDVYEVCPCEMKEKCEEKEFHHPNLKFCSKDLTWKSLHLFKINESMDYVVDDQFVFQGKEIDIGLSIVELEERNGDYEEAHESKSIFSEMFKGVGVFGFISDWLVYISLALSLFNFRR